MAEFFEWAGGGGGGGWLLYGVLVFWGNLGYYYFCRWEW